ncbi:hypothetical protein ET495_17135 [Xylanimonas allomyrinae]|uniref:Phage holin family protein n=1 Tax=Xylanimonas allomyrinae TaxID=2509459 RepID=A0A4P6EVU5_9MICO|nr:hypothetical protein [Xylanimonas allomyrinae]QAY64637.1 hypothetical protein ET495_17135 [Xylanimonas allomyrinae]
MNARVLSFVVAAVAYGVTLTVAALVLPGLHIGFLWAVFAWALFTLSITLLRPLITRWLSAHVHRYTWVTGLVTVLASLVVTSWLSPRSGFRIDNLLTWVLATVIVWVGTLVYDVVDDRIVAAVRPLTER